MNYYNEHDPDAAEVIRCAMEDGLIAPGHVDERSICDVQGSDLRGYVQCHFFSGAGTWSAALRLAGWPDDRPVWTASCPCPPFSAAGKKKRCPACGGRVIPHPRRTGVFACIECRHEWLADERHLFPELLRLIKECRPPELLGEQVAGPDGLAWFAGVRGTLEAEGYTAGAADLCGAWVGSPDLRQRLWWHAVRVGNTARERCEEGGTDIDRCAERAGLSGSIGLSTDSRCQCDESGRECGIVDDAGGGPEGEARQRERGWDAAGDYVAVGRPADAAPRGLGIYGGAPGQPGHPDQCGQAGGAADAQRDGGRGDQPRRGPQGRGTGGGHGETGYLGFWDAYRRVHYADGKDRRVEPESFGLDHGLLVGLEACRAEGLSEEEAAAVVSTWPTASGFPCRRPLLKLWGNAVKAQVAAAFVVAAMETENEDQV